MRLFRYEMDKTFARFTQFNVFLYEQYVGKITVWKDGYVGYSVDGMVGNLGIMKDAAEQYKVDMKGWELV